MQKFIVSVVVAFSVLCGASFYVYKTGNISETYENNETKEVNNNMLSMMLETSAGSGEYQKTSASAWPTEGYVFNKNLSKCEQGSSLSWDNTKNTVVMIGNSADKCYVYFDLIPPVYLADYIKGVYTTQGSNNLYFHDSTLEKGAGDNSYRYAGSSETTNNFVCFGYDSTDGTCPTDYLYRIIGVFDNQVKLIKYDYAKSTLLGTDGDYSGQYSSTYGTNKGENLKSEIGGYYWNNETGTNIWSESLLNTLNLNINYLNNIGAKWSNKIAINIWKVGGNTRASICEVTVSNTFQNEIISPLDATTYIAKIGLMYVSDYGYAASPSAWSKTLYKSGGNGYALVTGVNWMHMGLYEHTITHLSNSNFVFSVGHSGDIGHAGVNNEFAIRPCFYLNSNVSYVSGSGTISSPILIN